MTCEDLIEYLSDYLDHELDTDLVRAAKDHLATCERCQIVLHTTEGVISLGQRQQRWVLPPARRERLFARLQSAFLGAAGDGHE
jgi:predicted anti-sigma-YlaC factor YlaD